MTKPLLCRVPSCFSYEMSPRGFCHEHDRPVGEAIVDGAALPTSIPRVAELRAFVTESTGVGVVAGIKHRPLSIIAREIRADWKKVYFGAVPYLGAMLTMNKIDDSYGADDGRGIVQYFLSNAHSWRGEVAKRIKVELNMMLKGAK